MKTNIKRGDFVVNNNDMCIYMRKVPAGSKARVSRVSRQGNAHISFEGNLGYGYVNVSGLTKIESPKANIKVGDIFASDWGYEQTQTSWFKVMAISDSGKSVTVTRVGERREYTGPMSGKATVCPDDTHGVLQTFRLRVDGGGTPSFRVNSYSWAYLADPTASRFFSEWH